ACTAIPRRSRRFKTNCVARISGRSRGSSRCWHQCDGNRPVRIVIFFQARPAPVFCEKRRRRIRCDAYKKMEHGYDTTCHVACSYKKTWVELRGLEPLTPTLPVWCATSCATAPGLLNRGLVYILRCCAPHGSAPAEVSGRISSSPGP